MENPVPSHEVTTTLHLGVRSVADSSPVALIEKLIAESTAEEQVVLQEVMRGNGENAMVFIHRGPSRGARFLITSEGSTIGRTPASDIFLDDVTVSRRHAEFHRHGKKFQVKDLASLNGTYYDGVRIDAAMLEDGSEVQIGKFRLTFYSSKADLVEAN